MQKILFYTESPILGGHERMAFVAADAIRKYDASLQIEWLVNPQNARLKAALTEHRHRYTELDCAPAFAWKRNYLAAARKVDRIAGIIRKLTPDLVMIAQGGITGSYDGIFACRIAKVEYCSYIAMAHRSTELAAYRFPGLWNALRSNLYKPIRKYITLDEQQALRIAREHQGAQIEVVENYVPPPAATTKCCQSQREQLGLAPDKAVLAVVGRIEFQQKCQDWLVDALQEGDFLNNKTVVFVGDGPDLAQLTAKIQQSKKAENFKLLPWRENMDELYAAIDVLLIPSRAEGVPLVMLESLWRKIPVVGTDRDGMKTWLPAEWRYEFGDGKGLKKAVSAALSPAPAQLWDRISQRLSEVASEENFADRFSSALKQFAAAR